MAGDRERKSSGNSNRLAVFFRENSMSSTISADYSLQLNPTQKSRYNGIKPSNMSEYDDMSDGSFEDDLIGIMDELTLYSENTISSHLSIEAVLQRVIGMLRDKKETTGGDKAPMAGNDWINCYLEAILDVELGIDETESSSLLLIRKSSPTGYFVELVITGFDETDLHRSWVKAAATRSPQDSNTRLENMCWRIWNKMATSFGDRARKSSGNCNRFAVFFRENSMSSTISDSSLQLNPTQNSQYHGIKPSNMSDYDMSDGSFEDDLIGIMDELTLYSDQNTTSSHLSIEAVLQRVNGMLRERKETTGGDKDPIAGNDWINCYLEAILDDVEVGPGIDETESSSLLLIRESSPTRYFVELVITGFDETDLHRSWVKAAAATRSPHDRNTRLENMCWRIWNLARLKSEEASF